MPNSVDDFLQRLIANNPAEKEFHQAVQEVVESIWSLIERDPTAVFDQGYIVPPGKSAAAILADVD